MLSVVIPLYNEEGNVAPLCAEIAASLAGRAYEIVLVDDKSTDQTLQKIPVQPEIRVLELARNTGQSGAMYAGIRAAKGDILVLMDGDRQNDPADIPKMLETLEGLIWFAATGPTGRTPFPKDSLHAWQTPSVHALPRMGSATPDAH